MDQDERDHNESLLQIYRAHLRQLEIMAAKYGGLAVPSHITLEIEENRRKIAELESRLRTPASTRPAGPRHNLPPRDYERFVGRQKELAEVRRLLGPRSRAFVVTIDGIGGIGKSALALESAYSFVDQYGELPEDERFEAIVWVSAKRTYLTAGGIRERRQVFRTLEDVFAAIARVLDYPAITRSPAAEQREIVEQVLREQRALLILDNLETVDDDNLMDFLHELPQPTKAIVTTRHRIDVARTVRLVDMDHVDALALIGQEAMRKDVTLESGQPEELLKRTGGMPLAIVWSIGLIGLGASTESVLRQLGSGQSDIARFCFDQSVGSIRGKDAFTLLLTLALFETSVSRTMLGEVAGLGKDTFGRDEGLEHLLRLSLINKENDRFSLLPLTRGYVIGELDQQEPVFQSLNEQKVLYLIELAKPYAGFHWQYCDIELMQRDGPHFIDLINWSYRMNRPDVFLPILSAASYYEDLIGQWNELLAIARIGLEYAQLIGNDEAVMNIENYMIGWILSQQGFHEEAEHSFLHALAIAEKLGDILWQSAVLSNYSQALRRRNQFDAALVQCQRALELIKHSNEPGTVYARADIEYELGKIARDRGDWERARAHLLAARDVFRSEDEHPIHNLQLAWGVLSNLGLIAYKLGDLEQAAQIYRECYSLYGTKGAKSIVTTLRVRLALLEEARGRAGEAIAYAREALDWTRRLRMEQERIELEAMLTRLGETV